MKFVGMVGVIALCFLPILKLEGVKQKIRVKKITRIDHNFSQELEMFTKIVKDSLSATSLRLPYSKDKLLGMALKRFGANCDLFRSLNAMVINVYDCENLVLFAFAKRAPGLDGPVLLEWNYAFNDEFDVVSIFAEIINIIKSDFINVQKIVTVAATASKESTDQLNLLGFTKTKYIPKGYIPFVLKPWAQGYELAIDHDLFTK